MVSGGQVVGGPAALAGGRCPVCGREAGGGQRGGSLEGALGGHLWRQILFALVPPVNHSEMYVS